MRIAILSPLFESVPPRYYGGTERVVASLCRGLAQQGIEVTLFASGDSITDGKLIPVVNESFRLRSGPSIDSAAHHLRMLALVAEKASMFDLIHNHHDYWMLPLPLMTSTPLLTTVHGRMDLPDSAAVFSEYSRYSSFVSISKSQRAPLPGLSWVANIYHGLELADVEFYPEPGKYLAFLGRISPEKRPEWAIEIAKKSGVPLKIAAKIEGKVSQDYYDHFIEPHVDGRFIEYVGEISESEKSAFLGDALALVFPIDWPEPFGLVVIEALSRGTPVLARPIGAIPELLEDRVTGFLDYNIANLARRVPDIYRISRRGCRAWVEERLSLERMTKEYVHVYRRTIEQKFQRNSHRWNIVHSL